ncbi:MAG: hypothetical protein JRJ00_14485 [Deltaproteobacteria bacterium]|nr:hypothetical protein [Deltaproteobacteria bacterium]
MTTCSGSRFGTIAIENKFITMGNLIEAFKVQVNKEMGKSVCVEIGEILVELGYMVQEQVDEVLGTISEME